MANIFQGTSKQVQCVQAWDEQLRKGGWVDTDVFAEIFDFKHISYEEIEGYKKAIKKAKNDIRAALAVQGMSLCEKRCETDSRKVLTAYPEHCQDPLHNLRILAVIEDALIHLYAVRLVYFPSFHDRTDERIFHPHYMRIYNGRQYVYGIYENEADNNGLPFVALPIDRIQIAIRTKEVDYRQGDATYYEEQMRHVMGASPNFKDPEAIDVVLRTHKAKTHKLLLTKPLHHSIRELKPFAEDAPGELTLHVQRSIELDNWILHYGAAVEVIAPEDYRAHIASAIYKIYNYYK